MNRHLPRVLVIEDEPDILDLLDIHLRRMGFLVSTAQTGEKGVELAQADPPDAMLVDIMLPGIDGREVIRRIRGDPRTTRCFVIVCSVLDQQDLADVDADAALGKPFSKADVANVMKIAIGRGKP